MGEPTPRPSPGLLVLAGGGEFDERMAPADRAWLDRLPAPRPRLGVLPTANERHPALAARNGVRYFAAIGVEAEPVMVTDRHSANAESIPGQIERLDAIYMAGGSPLHLATVLAWSVAWAAVENRWRAGMALAGSSAGAMALCGSMLLAGRRSAGLGIVGGAAVLPHFNKNDAASAERLRLTCRELGIIGLGIDESTALVWDNGRWQVAGAGRITVLAQKVEVFGDGDFVPVAPQPVPAYFH